MFENILSVMIFLPIAAGFGLLLLPVRNEAARAVGLVAAVLVVICGLKVFFNFTGAGGLEFVEKVPWFASVGISYSLGVDGISLLVLMAGSCLFPMVYLLSTNVT